MSVISDWMRSWQIGWYICTFPLWSFTYRSTTTWITSKDERTNDCSFSTVWSSDSRCRKLEERLLTRYVQNQHRAYAAVLQNIGVVEHLFARGVRNGPAASEIQQNRSHLGREGRWRGSLAVLYSNHAPQAEMTKHRVFRVEIFSVYRDVFFMPINLGENILYLTQHPGFHSKTVRYNVLKRRGRINGHCSKKISVFDKTTNRL